MEILVIKMSALGDVIHALPVVPALKGAYPDSRIHWLVEEMAEPIVRANRCVDRVLVSRRVKWGRHLRHPTMYPGVFLEMRDLARQLRQHTYELAIDLQGLFKSGIWLGLTSARRKVGYNGAREGSYLFLNERVTPVNPDIHAVERYLSLVNVVGASVHEVNFGLSVSYEARTRLRGLLRARGWQAPNPYAVLVPTARWETKKWNWNAFAAVADSLVSELDLHVAITGIDRDRPGVDRITRLMRHRALNLAGDTDLPMLMALMEGARVVISTDSGPMHLAVAVGTPVVALFGPTAPWRTGPYGEGHRVIRKSLTCSPCFRRKCSHKACMEQIQPLDVIEAVQDILKGRD